MTNKEIAQFLYEIAEMLELKGENPFRANAYKQAGRAVEYTGEDIEDIYKEKGIEGLKKIPGIGESIALKIAELLETGQSKYYDDLKKDIAEVELEMMAIPQIGAKIARRLFEELKIKSLKDLEEKARAGKIRELKGFGPKIEENILKNLKRVAKTEKRMLLSFAEKIGRDLIDYLKKCDAVIAADLVGSLRRMKETIGDIDIVVSSLNPSKVIDYFCQYPFKKEIIAKGTTKASFIHQKGEIRVDLEVLRPENYGSLLQHLTGSKEHNIALRTYAKELGFSLSEYGIFDLKTQKREFFADEASFYQKLGLCYIPPELRENRGEIEAAKEGKLPFLLEVSSIKGDLHVHSTWSEGRLCLEDIAEEALKRGYPYIGISDHSAGLGITLGVDEKKLLRQIQEIEKLNQKYNPLGLFILKGVEANIKPDGSLDLKDRILKKLDYVIGAIHSSFRQPEKEMTERIIRAFKNPYLKILAHPSGRLIFKREGVDVDWEKIFRAALNFNVALEINSQPERLDLNDALIFEARKYGVLFVVNTDAHNKEDFEEIKYGIAMARRGWLEEKDVLNTRPLNKLLEFFNKGYNK